MTTTETTAVEPDSTAVDETAGGGADTTETAETGAGGDSGVEDQDDERDAGDQDDDAGDGSGREAAKYRRRLRAAEAERDTLKATVEAMQRAEVELLATAD